MTFFLSQEGLPKGRVGANLGAPSTLFEGLGAAFNKAALENDANLRARRETISEREAVARRAAGILGVDRIKPMVEEYNRKAESIGARSKMVDVTSDAAGMISSLGPNGFQQVLDAAREDAKANPNAWKGIDLTDEGIDARVNERLQAEHRDYEGILRAMPAGRGAAEFIGGMAGATFDVRNAPFLMLGGGGGSLLRVFAREAMLNVAAEATFLPSQFEMADRLNIENPNVFEHLATAALAGGVLGVGVEALARGFRYYAGMPTVAPDVPDAGFYENAVIAAGDALTVGDDPVAAAGSIVDIAPPARVPVNPLITDEDFAAAGMFQASQKEEAPAVTQPSPIEAAPDLGKLLDDTQAALDEAKKADNRFKKPLTEWIKRTDNKLDPAGPLAQELKARGITGKTAPGLFKKGGRGDLDNLVASELDNEMPGIIDATGTKYGSDYLDTNGLLEVLVRDAQGDSSWLRSRGEVARLEKQMTDIETAMQRQTAGSNFVAKRKTEDGLFIDPKNYGFDGIDPGEQISAEFDRWAAERGYDQALTPEEIRSIKAELQTRGGDAEYLVERAFERQLDYLDEPAPRTTETPESPRGRDGEPGRPVASEAGGGSTGAEGDRPAVATERTDAGDQYLFDGITPIAERQRLEAEQVKRLGGKPRGPDSEIGGLFDSFDKVRTDLFDDLASPQATALRDGMIAEMRSAIDAGGDVKLSMRADDGKEITSLQGLLDEIDDMRAMASEADACRLGGVVEE